MPLKLIFLVQMFIAEMMVLVLFGNRWLGRLASRLLLQNMVLRLMRSILTLEEGEIEQANYHRGNWLDIEANMAGHADGVGNALGGVAFEWLDEWWKNYEPY